MFRLKPFGLSLNLLKSAMRPRALSLTLPFLLYGLYHKTSCFFGFGTKIERNKLQDRTIIAQYPANNPAEDRWATYQLTNADGYVAAVFDGHVGWHLAEYAKKNIGPAIDAALAKNKGKYPAGNQDKLIIDSLNDAFNEIENNFLTIAKGAYQMGFAKLGGQGSCALVLVVANNKLYTANAGDSQALVFEAKDKDQLTFTKLNKKLNANSKKEKVRLQALFPTEKDIIQCYNNNPKHCYVKGRLQPTRSFGDFRLKFADFNNPQGIGRQYGYLGHIKNFTGPYVTHVPQIRVIDLTPNHKCAVIASDGLWDDLTKQQVTNIVSKKVKDNKIDNISQALLDAALQKAAAQARMSVSDLKNIPQGERRRRLHDDITVVTINLQKQTS